MTALIVRCLKRSYFTDRATLFTNYIPDVPTSFHTNNSLLV